MTKSKAEKGARGEREVVEIFDAAGFNQAQRGRAGATDDRGDVAGIQDLTVEVKNYNDVNRALIAGMKELAVEKVNNKTRWGVLCVKRKYRGWVAILPLDEFALMYAELAKPTGERREMPTHADGPFAGRNLHGAAKTNHEKKQAGDGSQP